VRALIPLASRTTVVMALAAALAVMPPVGAAATARQSPAGPPLGDTLNGVAAVSPSQAWAVGSYGVSRTLILRWNGTVWKRQATPGNGAGELYGVTTLSASSAWAVGFSGGTPRTLILHWNGTSWTRQASPSPAGHDSFLYGVAALSANSAWAVGRTCEQDSLNCENLIEYWNGTFWARQASPTPAGDFLGFNAVAAISASDAWAVGWGYGTGKGEQPLIEHWDGTSWKQVVIGNTCGKPGLFCDFLGVSAVSAASVWAVGDVGKTGALRTLIEHWNGTSWTRQKSPNGAYQQVDSLCGIAAVSPSSAWAVGSYSYDSPKGSSDRTLIEHWDGTAWKIDPSPSPGGYNDTSALNAVAPISASRAWAVGVVVYGISYNTLVEHWNGRSWRHWGSPSF
jgi:hypothetical protein